MLATAAQDIYRRRRSVFAILWDFRRPLGRLLSCRLASPVCPLRLDMGRHPRPACRSHGRAARAAQGCQSRHRYCFVDDVQAAARVFSVRDRDCSHAAAGIRRDGLLAQPPRLYWWSVVGGAAVLYPGARVVRVGRRDLGPKSKGYHPRDGAAWDSARDCDASHSGAWPSYVCVKYVRTAQSRRLIHGALMWRVPAASILGCDARHDDTSTQHKLSQRCGMA